LIAAGGGRVIRELPTIGQVVSAQARLEPDRIGARDLERAMTFKEWNARACRLAHALLDLGLAKGDRVAVLAHNCIEWLEIYTATAKAGLVAVPVNFRLTAPEVGFVVGDAETAAMIVQDELVHVAEEIPADLPAAIQRALANAPVLIDVVTSQSAVSSDAKKGPCFVPDYQPLTVRDDAERRRRGV
jgi:fatty-acyl-CoA synthase